MTDQPSDYMLVPEAVPAVVPPQPQIASNQPPIIANDALDINIATGKPVDLSKQRHFLAAFFFSFFFGVFGVDRFYLGKVWTGILKFLTFGGLGVWATVDLSLIISGSMRDKQGNKLIDADKYKKLAKRTVFFSFLIIITVVVVSSAIAVYYVMQFIQSGGINQLTDIIIGGGNQTTVDPDQIQSILNSLSI